MSAPPINFAGLFRDPRVFDSKDAFRSAGFEVKQPSSHNIMVGSHASAPGYLFKKYDRHVSSDEQLANYKRRAEGARRLRKFIAAEHLKHITVPRKWVCELSRDFASRHVLVVERMDILPSREVERRYRDISEDVLKELCLVLFEFRGLDSALHNVNFTRSGQIAFVDTENWNRSKSKVMHFIKEHLSERSRKRAKRMFKKLGHDEHI